MYMVLRAVCLYSYSWIVTLEIVAWSIAKVFKQTILR